MVAALSFMFLANLPASITTGYYAAGNELGFHYQHPEAAGNNSRPAFPGGNGTQVGSRQVNGMQFFIYR